MKVRRTMTFTGFNARRGAVELLKSWADVGMEDLSMTRTGGQTEDEDECWEVEGIFAGEAVEEDWEDGRA